MLRQVGGIEAQTPLCFFAASIIKCGMNPAQHLDQRQCLLLLERKRYRAEPLEKFLILLEAMECMLAILCVILCRAERPLPDLSGIATIREDDEMVMIELTQTPLDFTAHEVFGHLPLL